MAAGGSPSAPSQWPAVPTPALERAARRAYDGVPLAIPHPVFMREHCVTCHTGETARQEILGSHPERVHCVKCHVPATVDGEFALTER